MVIKFFFLSANFILVVQGLIFGIGETERQVAAQLRRIRQASLMISITVPDGSVQPESIIKKISPSLYRVDQPAAASGRYIAAEGLGILVNRAGELLIVTHDHWSVLDQPEGQVQIRDGDGRLLTEQDLKAFKQLIRYHDGGTLVVAAPEEIEVANEIRPASLAEIGPRVGDTVFLTHRQQEMGGGVAFMEAMIDETAFKKGKPIIRLKGLADKPIAAGDSGGGVWLEGKLIATMWTTVMMENIQTGTRRATNESVAALTTAWSASSRSVQLRICQPDRKPAQGPLHKWRKREWQIDLFYDEARTTGTNSVDSLLYNEGEGVEAIHLRGDKAQLRQLS